MGAGRRVPVAELVAAIAAVGALLWLPAVAQAAPDPCAYTGLAGGSWDSGANWSCLHEPDADDDVTLSTGDSVLVTTTNAVAGTLQIELGATLAFANSRVLDVSGAVSAATGTITGTGELDAGGGLTKIGIGQLAVSGPLVVLEADSAWNGGDLCLTTGTTLRVQALLSVATGAGNFNCSSSDSLVQVRPTGSIAVAGGARSWFSRVDDDGRISLAAGTLTLQAGSPNNDAGAWSIAAPATLVLSADRTLGASGSIGGAGALTASSGTLAVPGGASLNPAALNVAGGTVTVNGTTPAQTFPTVNLTAGTLGGTRNRSITTLAAQAGTLTGANTTSVTGSLVKSTTGQLAVNGGISLAPSVDVTWSAGDICISEGSTLRVTTQLSVAAGAGAFNCSSGDSLVDVRPTGSIAVAGGDRSWFSRIDDDGSITLSAGTLNLQGSSANTDAGLWAIAAPAALTLSADRTLAASGSLGGPGALTASSGTLTVPDNASLSPATLNVAGGTVTIDGSAPAQTLPAVNLTAGVLGGTRNRSITTLAAQAGTLSGANTTTVTGSLVKSTAGQVIVSGGILLRPTVDVSWNAGDICVTTGSVVRVEHAVEVAAAAGNFNCSSDDSLVDVRPTGSITVAGGDHSWFSRIDDDGRISLAAGTLTLQVAGANSDAGAWSIGAPSTLVLNADRTLGGGSLGGPGTVTAASGTLTVPDNATLNPATLNVAGGAVTVNGTTPALSLPAVNLSAGTLGGTRNRSIGTLAATGGAVSGAHTATITAGFTKSGPGQLMLTGGAVLALAVDGTWSGGDICITTASTLRIAHAFSIPDTAGTFNCTGADSLVDVVAGGSIALGGGNRTWFSRVDDGGLITIDAGESITFNDRLRVVAGGVLTGSGTAGGAVVNAGTVRPGGSPGRLTIGTYTQEAAGTLEVEIAGTAPGTTFDQLAVTGSATLAGTLAIVRAPSFDPDVGQTFQVLTSTSRTGQFGTLTGATIGAGAKAFALTAKTPGSELIVSGPALPVPGKPVVTGTVAVGGTVACAEGTWTGGPAFTYQWLRDGAPIASATDRDYVVVLADAGRQLACRVTGTNGGGSTSATSPGVGVPVPATPTPTPTATATASPTPSPTPIPTPTPTPPLQGATPGQVAKALRLPSAKHCLPRDTLVFRLHAPSGIRIRSAKAFLDGRPLTVRKVDGKFSVKLDLRNVTQRQVTLTIGIRTRDGRTLRARREYEVCRRSGR